MGDAIVVSLAERLRDRRAELGISQAQAARDLDVARTAYRLWELEAAKPAPDRWRLIARWLGVSMTTLLVAEEMMTADEASSHGAAAAQLENIGRVEPATGIPDFFTQGRAQLDAGVARGEITAEEARALARIFVRMESERAPDDTTGWEPAELRKSLPADGSAPAAARAAVAFVGEGLPDRELETARLLSGQLVANSVEHGPSETIGLLVNVGRDTVRVEVADRSSGSPRAPSEAEAARLQVVSTIADRWGGGRSDGLNVTWFEIDLPAPGSDRAEPGS